jgi:hypothetical protein
LIGSPSSAPEEIARNKKQEENGRIVVDAEHGIAEAQTIGSLRHRVRDDRR